MPERRTLHRGDVAVVVQMNSLAAKLAGHYAPTAAEDLQLYLVLDADADSEAPKW
jgi:hypothetical protein